MASQTSPVSTMFHGKGGRSAVRPFRDDVQGLRGIAVLLVVLYHAGVPGLSGGFVGVDVFFVISGFLITPILYDEVLREGRIDFLNFMARRIRRLLPAMIVVLIFTGLAGLLIYSPYQHSELANTVLSCAVYASNLLFVWRQTDYLADNLSESPLLHTWSLSVEEQFYFIWPLTIFAFARIGRRTQKGVYFAVISGIGLAGALSFASSVWLTDTYQSFAFFMMPTRIWEFAAGGAAALSTRLFSIYGGNRWLSLASFAALVILLATASIFDEQTLFPGTAAAIPVIATTVLLALGSWTNDGPMTRALKVKPLSYVGTISYSFYLWHWPILLLADELGTGEHIIERLFLVAISFIVAIISYHCIENPVRHSRVLSSKPLRSISMLVVFSCVGIVAALTWRLAAEGWKMQPDQKVYAAAAVQNTTLRDAGCVADFYERAVRPCRFGTQNGSRTIVLLGDSHAAQWFTPIREIAERRGWKLITLVKVACPPAHVSFYYQSLGRRYRECEQWRGAALQYISELAPELVVVTGSLAYAVDPEAWRTGTGQLFDELTASGSHVLQLRDNPRPGFDVVACLSQASWGAEWRRSLGLPPQDCRFERAGTLNTERYKGEYSEIAARRLVTGLDLTDRICPGSICPVERSGQVIYRDTNHLTEYFVKTLSGELSVIINKIMSRRTDSEIRSSEAP
ncbi:acyltransferase family protein [Altererythrobacter aurantiacus]|uniref:Acyltransferase family protein n=1 Tax=Parapontixanthobacter aurantiacus TaxID=1463599 RepID=A0A844ZAH6_9SPHN|nr:acyltransferase family protein [Parapontixanthobacter aurantiacus]MXO84915.1 acyltransferase family protein [Parapontixanthobacter aurantiacus]